MPLLNRKRFAADFHSPFHKFFTVTGTLVAGAAALALFGPLGLGGVLAWTVVMPGTSRALLAVGRGTQRICPPLARFAVRSSVADVMRLPWSLIFPAVPLVGVILTLTGLGSIVPLAILAAYAPWSVTRAVKRVAHLHRQTGLATRRRGRRPRREERAEVITEAHLDALAAAGSAPALPAARVPAPALPESRDDYVQRRLAAIREASRSNQSSERQLQ